MTEARRRLDVEDDGTRPTTEDDRARPSRPTRTRSVTDLLSRHDALFADLDGTLYAGPAAVPGAVEAVRAAADRGVRTAYITNNASRSPADVAAHLAELGFPATAQDVVASSQAGAALLAEQLPPGRRCWSWAPPHWAREVTGVGLALTERGDDAVAVVQGHSPDTGWRLLAEATVALRAGAVWVACNLDPTLPTERGPMPGNGAMVAALRTASGREPQVAGKPAPTLMRDAVRRTGARVRPHDRRPDGHRHRGRAGCRAGHAAGAHRFLGPGRAARGAGTPAPRLRRRRPGRADRRRRRAGPRAAAGMGGGGRRTGQVVAQRIG